VCFLEGEGLAWFIAVSFFLQKHHSRGHSGRESRNSEGHDILGTHGSAVANGRSETRAVDAVLGGKLLVHIINHVLRTGRRGDAAVGPAVHGDHRAETVLLVTGHLRGIDGNDGVPSVGGTGRENLDRAQETSCTLGRHR